MLQSNAKCMQQNLFPVVIQKIARKLVTTADVCALSNFHEHN